MNAQKLDKAKPLGNDGGGGDKREEKAKAIQNVERARKKVKNVFTYMQSTYASQAPKSLLYRAIEENRRIKVWTRSHTYVRSICTGYLVAYDQYWNLAMKDVDEVYKIPNSRLERDNILEATKSEKEDETTSAHSKKRDDDLSHLFSELNLYKSGRFNLFERHVNQLLIRGDNVVTIAFADK